MARAWDVARAIRRRAGRRSADQLPEVPVHGAADSRWSVISSASDFATQPTQPLVDLMLDVGRAASMTDLSSLVERCSDDWRRWVQTWPGEHYRLLAALADHLQPEVIVEVGTFNGHGSLALAGGCPAAQVLTYDIVQWSDFPDTVLREADFTEGNLTQWIGDLEDDQFLAEQLPELRLADLVFIDGPKDGVWEQRALPKILDALSDRRRLVVLDDIRLLEMVQLWRDLPYEKVDATSLGHWSGTGFLWTA